MEEFYDDYARVKYVKRLLVRYRDKGDLKERLILNHLILLYNVFDPSAITKILFHKLDTSLHSSLKTFLLYLGFEPVAGHSDIPVDSTVASILRKI